MGVSDGAERAVRKFKVHLSVTALAVPTRGGRVVVAVPVLPGAARMLDGGEDEKGAALEVARSALRILHAQAEPAAMIYCRQMRQRDRPLVGIGVSWLHRQGRMAVQRALKDPRLRAMSTRELGRELGLSHTIVRKHRAWSKAARAKG